MIAQLDLSRTFILFGANPISEQLIEKLSSCSVRYVLDRNKDKQSESLRGIPVVDPTTFYEENSEDCLVVITSDNHADSMIKDLLNHRILPGQIIHYRKLIAQLDELL